MTHGPGMQPMPIPKPPRVRDWLAAPGDRVLHYYAQGGHAMAYSLCNKPCLVGVLQKHAGLGYCKKCWTRLPSFRPLD